MNHRTITKAQITSDYPHRIKEDGSAMWGCPVCCGDGRTTDARYGSVVVRRKEDGHLSDVYACKACEVWED